MSDREVIDDLGEAKQYLEDVMGIVEDEEFNRERRKNLKMAKDQETDFEEDDFEYSDSGEPFCCTKILFFLLLSVFLTSSLLVLTNYKEDDSLGLRNMIQKDSLGLASVAILFDSDKISKNLQVKELINLPVFLLNGLAAAFSEMKPILSKLWYFFEQKWLTPSVRVYKENFPFLKPGEKRNKDIDDKKDKEEKPKVTENKDNQIKEEVKTEHIKHSDEKIKDFKRLQEERRISSKDNFRKKEKKEENKDIPSKKHEKDNSRKLKEDYGTFVRADL